MIHGSDEFFGVTKAVHNALQGADVEWTTQMERIYLETVLDNALLLEGEWDFVVIHDPQPAAMLELRRATTASTPESTKWIWRCHIDLTDANPTVWEFFRPFVEQYDASVWTMPRVRARVAARWTASCIAPPCIDPLSVKNLELPMPFVEEIMQASTASTRTDPLIVPGEPVRPVEGPGRRDRGVPHRARGVPDAQLVLAGSMATDDPEGFHFWELADEARAGDRDIHLLSNIQQVGVGADQRVPARRPTS